MTNKQPTKRRYITSFGIIFVEDPDYFIKISKSDDNTIRGIIAVANGGPLFQRIKFFIVRIMYKKLFDKQLKRKGNRTALTIAERRRRSKQTKKNIKGGGK